MPDTGQTALVYTLLGVEEPGAIFSRHEEGDSMHPLKLFRMLAINNARGVLTVRDNSGMEWRIGLDNGGCYGAVRKDEPQDLAIGKKIAKDEGLDFTTVAGIIKDTRKSGKGTMGLIKSLLETGKITAKKVLEVIRANTVEILDEVTGLQSGEAVLDPGDRLRVLKNPEKVDLMWYVSDYASRILKKMYFRELFPGLEHLTGFYPGPKDTLTDKYMDSLLTEKERISIGHLDGSITLKDYFSITNLSKHDAARMITRLLLLDFMKFDKYPVSDASIRKKEAELEDTLTRFSVSDHFTRLGVHWTAHESEIEKAFQKRIMEWGEDSKLRKVSDKTREACEKLFAYAEEAYAVLSDEEKRREYRQSIIEPRKLLDGADFLYQQAQISLFRGDVDGARKLIESALDIAERPLFRKFYHKLGGGLG